MPSYNPPKRATAYIVYVALVSQANTKLMQASPTIAAGDFTVSIDGGAFANLATLPTVTPAAGKIVKISLSAAEMTGDNIAVVCSDASGAEWCTLVLNLATVVSQMDDLATAAALTIVDDLLDTEIPALTTAVGLLPSAAAITTAVWASGTRTLTSFGTLIADIWANVTRTLTSGGGASAADVWGYVTRTLTQTAAQVAASVTGSDLTIVRGVTFTATLTGLTIPATWSKIYFTAKQHRAVDDTDAVVQIVVSNPAAPLTDGLLRINRLAGTLANGSLVVDQGAGTVAITLADDASTLLISGAYAYDVKALLSDGTSVLLTAANVTVADTVTEAVA